MFTLRQTAENLVILIITKYIHELYMVKKTNTSFTILQITNV